MITMASLVARIFAGCFRYDLFELGVIVCASQVLVICTLVCGEFMHQCFSFVPAFWCMCRLSDTTDEDLMCCIAAECKGMCIMSFLYKKVQSFLHSFWWFCVSVRNNKGWLLVLWRDMQLCFLKPMSGSPTSVTNTLTMLGIASCSSLLIYLFLFLAHATQCGLTLFPSEVFGAESHFR